MKKKICVILIAVLVAVLGTSIYFKLITLSACEYSRNNSRLVVVAKHITEDGGADAAKPHAEATAEGERPN